MSNNNYVLYFAHLLNIGERLYGQMHGVADRLCQEVALVTQGHAQLVLHRRLSDRAQAPPPSSIGFPVQSGSQIYGTLYVALDPAQPTYPIIPASIADPLAQLCGMLLYALEVSALLQVQYQRFEHQACEALTKREREVLMLMCGGYNQETIANRLHITPATVAKHRQHIYEKLHVHNELDVLLVAYREGLFSPLAAISSKHS